MPIRSSWPRATRAGIGAAFLACTCLAPATAAASETDTLRITWPLIVRLADDHPRLGAARFEATAARGALDAAGALPNLSVSGSLGRGAPPKTPVSEREWDLELALPLGWLTQRACRVGDASAQWDASKAQAQAVRREALHELRGLFWNLAHDQARVDALEVMRNQTAELTRLVTLRVEKGEARPTEVARAEIELEKVEIELEAGRSALQARRSQARLWIRGGANRELRMEADLAALSPVANLDSALRTARASHPAIRAAQARVRGSASALGLERVSRFPEIELRGFTAEEPDRRIRGLGLAVDLPLWNWNSGGVAQAKALLQSGRKQLEWQTREIESAVIEAHGASLAAKQAAARYRDRILPRSEAAATIMEKAYRIGEAGLLEVIDARRVLVEARLQYLAALVEAQVNDSQLDALTGREDTP